jgi:hypothetical protein
MATKETTKKPGVKVKTNVKAGPEIVVKDAG